MTITDVRKRVADIREMSCDDETAHSAEDILHQNVLYAISQGADNPAELAEEALKTGAINFARWCA